MTIGGETENLINESINLMTNKITDQISDKMKNENKSKSCINEELVKNKYCNGSLTEKQIGEIHDDIKNTYINQLF